MSALTFLTQQQEVASELRLDLTNADQLTLVKRWLNQSQADIWSRYDWQFALDREIVQTVVDKTAGTVSVSAGGTSVSGSSTAFDTTADVGKYIQFSSSDDWYKITAVSSTIALTIEAPYVGTSALSAGTYTIRQFFYSVSSNVEKVLDVRQATTPIKLEMVSYRRFDLFRPNPEATASPSLCVVYGYDSSNNWRFSLYPSPSSIINLEIRTKKKPTDLSANGDISAIPEKWHSTVLIDGALYRGLNYVRTGDTDKRAEFKQREFEEGISRMMADAEPESDYHPVMDNSERKMGIFNRINFPTNYER